MFPSPTRVTCRLTSFGFSCTNLRYILEIDRFLYIIGRDHSVSKSNQLQVDILRVFLYEFEVHCWDSSKMIGSFPEFNWFICDVVVGSLHSLTSFQCEWSMLGRRLHVGFKVTSFTLSLGLTIGLFLLTPNNGINVPLVCGYRLTARLASGFCHPPKDDYLKAYMTYFRAIIRASVDFWEKININST